MLGGRYRVLGVMGRGSNGVTYKVLSLLGTALEREYLYHLRHKMHSKT